MNILLINPPHLSIGSRIPHEHLPPLGLLAVGGPLIDDGHQVSLLDAELKPLSQDEIVDHVLQIYPDAVLIGHSGSTSAHPIICELTQALRQYLPELLIIYGGVFPTFHWREILKNNPQFYYIVRGEGEGTARQLMRAIEHNAAPEDLRGVAFRRDDQVVSTPDAPPIRNLDDYRIGWELIDFNRYSYWGDKRAVVVQFSRGCNHQCSYCGQRFFWGRWHHREPKRFAAELARLHREHGVEVINFADENPTTNKQVWRAFLEAMIAEDVPLTLVGSTRADDIVRDADILHLYRKAGVERFLLGIENYNEDTLRKINKGATTANDRKAIELLRKHDIISLATYVVGFEEETAQDYLRSLKQLLSYDPDQIQMIYATPHRWTPFHQEAAQRQVIQADLRRWDYKHQVLAVSRLKPWQVLLWVKFLEAAMQSRPRAIRRLLYHPNRAFHRAMRWYYRIGRKVWFREIWNFFFRDRRLSNGPALKDFQYDHPVTGSIERTVSPYETKHYPMKDAVVSTKTTNSVWIEEVTTK